MRVETNEDLHASGSVDPIDRASEEADMAQRDARVRHERRAAVQMPPPLLGPDGRPTGECLACGDDVEPQRIAMNLGTCFSCAQAREASDRRRNKTGAR